MVIGSEILSEKQMILIGILVVIFVVFAVLVNLLDNKSLNGIKAKKIGDGQHGTARWATKSEIKQTFICDKRPRFKRRLGKLVYL